MKPGKTIFVKAEVLTLYREAGEVDVRFDNCGIPLDAAVNISDCVSIPLIAGEPMVCEKHPYRLWDGSTYDSGCPGPGMPLSGIAHRGAL
jgi:hypothetical protein